MIVALGTDIVEIARFAQWHTKKHHILRRVFSVQEIDYCLREKQKSAERFAVRFAAKEALYKALCQVGHKIAFLKLCAVSEVILLPFPAFLIDKNQLKIGDLAILLSMSHSITSAFAVVVLQNIQTGKILKN